MFRTIMVPLDGTRFAEAALPTAMYFAKRYGAPLELVRVWQPAPTIGFMPESANDLPEVERESQENDRRYTAAVAKKVQDAVGSEVSVRYLVGQPASELARRALAGDCDLVVMSTHAHGPITRAFVGSVSDRVMRTASVPLLLIRPGDATPEVELAPSPPFRRVLVPLDGSPLAETALDDSLLDCLEAEKSEITLLHVTGFPAGPSHIGYEVVAEPGARVWEDSTDAEAYLSSVAEPLAASWGFRVTTRVVVSATTGAAIVDFAKSNGNDLIAMATHGRGGAARLILGSVADTVVRTSPVPTLLYPAAHSDKGRARVKTKEAEVEF